MLPERLHLLFHRRPVQIENRTKQVDDRRALLAAAMPGLRSFVRRIAGSGELAREIIQETCLKVLGADEVPDSSRFSAWCRSVARNVWIAQRRRSTPPMGAVALDGMLHRLPDLRADPERRVYASERIARASSGLDGESARLLVRRYVLGERAVDLAGEHEQNPSAVRTRLWRLRSTLRTRKRR